MSSPDWGVVADRAVDFIRRQVADAGSDGVVFGLSGGIDSSVTAYLWQEGAGEPVPCGNNAKSGIYAGLRDG